MTTLATRTREIADLEGFDIEVLSGGQTVDLKTNGLPRYNFDKKVKSDMTVAEWKTRRFYPGYPGYECRVLYGDGSEANGNAKLATVRASYEE
jgi:hypothetical protein